MVGVAQLVEHLVVVQVVAGSSPVTHPTKVGPRRYLRGPTSCPWRLMCSGAKGGWLLLALAAGEEDRSADEERGCCSSANKPWF